MLKELLISMRPHQWYKNLVIFVYIVFSFILFNFQMWFSLTAAFAVFCILSGSGYVINDVLDIEKDRRHPKKSQRPVPSGELKISYAVSSATFLTFIALIGAYLINMQLLSISIIFFLLLLLYSVYLKHLILVDVLTISTGFVIRAVAGCV